MKALFQLQSERRNPPCCLIHDHFSTSFKLMKRKCVSLSICSLAIWLDHFLISLHRLDGEGCDWKIIGVGIQDRQNAQEQRKRTTLGILVQLVADACCQHLVGYFRRVASLWQCNGTSQPLIKPYNLQFDNYCNINASFVSLSMCALHCASASSKRRFPRQMCVFVLNRQHVFLLILFCLTVNSNWLWQETSWSFCF